MGTTDLARKAAHAADALLEYGHLPEIGNIGVGSTGPVVLYPEHGRSTNDQMKTVTAWASAFGVPVVIDMVYGAALTARVQLGGLDVIVSLSLSPRMAYALGAALGVPVTAGGTVEVSPARLDGVLGAHVAVTRG